IPVMAIAPPVAMLARRYSPTTL
ncbi:MAG: hypothetical protein RLZZ565_296, partial [Planctomycetota bacterium]